MTDVKNKVKIQVKIGEREYFLECEPESPLGEIHDALCMIKNYVIQKMVDAQKEEKSKVCDVSPCSTDCPT